VRAGPFSRHAKSATTRAARRKVAGVAINYDSGGATSSHDIKAAPNKSVVQKTKKVVKQCKREHGKLKLVHHRVVCKTRR